MKKETCTCKNCSISFKKHRASTGQYCSNKCQAEFYFLEKIEKFLNGNDGIFLSATSQRRALIKLHGCKCSVCSIEDWNDKQIVFEVDHIDGNANNNVYNNLRLICPNCHSQTETYKARNKGNGREKRLNDHHKRRKLALDGSLF